jgi:hypothetical protein
MAYSGSRDIRLHYPLGFREWSSRIRAVLDVAHLVPTD